MERLLIVFIKNPKKGHVKTRLAKSIGNERALAVYEELLRITKTVTDKLSCHRQVWYSRFIDNNDFWPNKVYEKRLQKGKNLGERMKSAFRNAFKDDYKKAVIIGSDCSHLSKQIIDQAFSELNNHDLVIGPSPDGGYYLLGMSSFHSELFDDKAWSTSSVLNQTLKQAKAGGLSCKLLPELNDIDTKEDLDAMIKKCKTGISPLERLGLHCRTVANPSIKAFKKGIGNKSLKGS